MEREGSLLPGVPRHLILSGRHAERRLEPPVEVTLIRKPNFTRDVRDGSLSFPQQLHGMRKPDVRHVSHERHVGDLLEQTDKMRLAEPGDPGRLGVADLLRITHRDMVEQFFHPLRAHQTREYPPRCAVSCCDDHEIAGLDPMRLAAVNRHEQFQPFMPRLATRRVVGVIMKQFDDERKLAVNRLLIATSGIQLVMNAMRLEQQALDLPLKRL